jgi:hypothetical protein
VVFVVMLVCFCVDNHIDGMRQRLLLRCGEGEDRVFGGAALIDQQGS